MLSYDPTTGEIFLYDEIGPGWLGMIDDKQVVEALSDIGKQNRVTVRINSPGGFVDEGVGIFNALKRHPGGVDTVVDSLAASMASQIMLVGEKREIANNAKVMIHSVRGGAYGTASELRKTADVFDKYEQAAVADYAEKMGIDADEVRYLLDEETWYLGSEAVEAGLATAVIGESNVEPVRVAENRYKNTPKDLIDDSIGSIVAVSAPNRRIAASGAQSQMSRRVAAIMGK